MERIYKTVDDSRVETVYLIRPTHLNGANRLFGGILMQWIDEAAGIVAKRHCGGNVTTASVDNLTFLHGAYQNDMVVIKGKLTWVGKSSMEVCVDTYVENLQGERHRINNAHFMMVALDENDKPMSVPGLRPCTPAGVLALLDRYGISVNGRKVAIRCKAVVWHLFLAEIVFHAVPIGFLIQSQNQTNLTCRLIACVF